MDVDSPEDLSAIGRELEAMLLAGDVPEAPERWSPVPPAEQAAATPVATQPISMNQAPPALNSNTFTNPVTGQTVNYDSIAVISATTSQQPQTNYESPRHSAPPPPDLDAPQGDAPRPPPNPDDAPVPVGNPAAQVPTSAYALSPAATPAYGSLVSAEVSAPASEAQARGAAYGSLVSAEVSAQASGASGAPATEVSATGTRRPAYGTVISADGSGVPPADHPLAVPGFFAEPVAAGSVASDQQQAPKTGAGELSLDALSSSLAKATPDRSTGSPEPRSGLDGSGSASGTMGATGGGDEISASPRTSVDGASPRATSDGPGVPPSAIRGGTLSPPAMGSPTAIRVVGMDDKTLIRTPTARRITGAKLRGDGPHKIFKVSLEGTGQHGFVTLDYPNGTTMQAVLRYVITKRKLPEDVYSLRYAKSALTGQVTDLPPEMTVGQLEDVNLAIVGKTSGHRVVEKSGHLKMVGSNALRRRVWKRRWFVLKNNRLGSHAKEFDKMIHSIDLDLLDPEAVEPASSQVDGKKKKAKKQETGLFSITIPPGAISAHSDKDMREVKVGGKSSKEKDVVIHLRAADDEQRDDWIKVLRSSIERHRVKKSFPAETTSPNTRTSEAEGPSETTSELSELSTGDSSSVGPADNSDVTVADFELLHVVGKGSFGKVLQVRHKYSGQIYAMKVLAKKSIIANDEIEAAVTERNVLEQLVHPFLVTLYFSFQTADKLYFIMDFINGGELLHYLEMEESLTPDRIRFYSAEIVLALEYLHSCGVVYRDLKPENVLINFDGHVILTDFGLSKMGLAEDERTMTLCGTPDYIAPEIIMSEYTQKGYGKPVDIWSLGCLIFEMYTGTTPFYSPNMQETFTMIARNELKIPANVSDPATRNLLEGLLQKQEERRVTIDQIKQHMYFETVDWDALLQKQVKPPFVPEVKSKSDVSQIAEEFLAEPANTDPDSDSEEEVDDAMMDDAEAFFSGFLTFVSPEQPKEEARG